MAHDAFARTALGATFREESGRVVAAMISRFGDVDLAEEGVQEAFAEAARTWPVDGVPPNPGGWITTTARRRILDRIRATGRGRGRQQQLEAEFEEATMDTHAPDEVHDEQLRLVLLCCHPALAPDARVALTLRLVCGLQTSEIARAFLAKEATVGQRLSRAKQKIKLARIPFVVPSPDVLAERLTTVLHVIYLIFNEGYVATSGDRLDRPDLVRQAMRLADLVADLLPDEPEVDGLVALMLLTRARRPARTDEHGNLVRLVDQDRLLWDRELIARGHELVESCIARNQPGPFQLQAAIAAVHTDAASADDTDWFQVLALYDQLQVMLPTTMVALNRAVVIGQIDGPRAALALVDELALDDHHLWHAVRADLLERLDEPAAALQARRRAADLATNAAESRFLRSHEPRPGNS